MPIKPENKKLYGPDWPRISAAIRFGRARRRCENCGAIHGQRLLFGKGTIYLAAAHLNHQPGDNRKSNLKALCQACHLNYDRADNLRRAKLTRMLKRIFRQATLFVFDFTEEKKDP